MAAHRLPPIRRIRIAHPPIALGRNHDMLRLLALSLFAFISAARAVDYTVERDVLYTPAGWPEALRADLYLPQAADGARPAVLLVHGGGWRSRSRNDMNGI